MSYFALGADTNPNGCEYEAALFDPCCDAMRCNRVLCLHFASYIVLSESGFIWLGPLKPILDVYYMRSVIVLVNVIFVCFFGWIVANRFLFPSL